MKTQQNIKYIITINIKMKIRYVSINTLNISRSYNLNV